MHQWGRPTILFAGREMTDGAREMIEVALWSRYPTGYVKDKIEPKLKKHGIIVSKFLSINDRGWVKQRMG